MWIDSGGSHLTNYICDVGKNMKHPIKYNLRKVPKFVIMEKVIAFGIF